MGKTTIEVSDEERKALAECLDYIRRKALKSAWWAERFAPLRGLTARLSSGARVEHLAADEE